MIYLINSFLFFNNELRSKFLNFQIMIKLLKTFNFNFMCIFIQLDRGTQIRCAGNFIVGGGRVVDGAWGRDMSDKTSFIMCDYLLIKHQFFSLLTSLLSPRHSLSRLTLLPFPILDILCKHQCYIYFWLCGRIFFQFLELVYKFYC